MRVFTTLPLVAHTTEGKVECLELDLARRSGGANEKVTGMSEGTVDVTFHEPNGITRRVWFRIHPRGWMPPMGL